jgi:hypothetical protein
MQNSFHMKKHFIRTLLLLISSFNLLHAQNGLYNNSGGIVLSGNSLISIQGNFSNVGTTPTLSLGTGSLYITGDVENNQNFTSANGSVFLIGTNPQEIKGTNPMRVQFLDINNPSGITLSTAFEINNRANFIQGIVTAPNQNQPLRFSTNASTIGESDQSHVNGYVSKMPGLAQFNYPVGDGVRLQRIEVSGAAGHYFTVRYQPVDALSGSFGSGGTQTTPLTNYNALEYWEIIPVSGTASLNWTVYWDDYKNTGIGSTADLRVANKVAGTWLNQGAALVTGTIASGSVRSNAFTSNGIITLGSISTNSTLPANWLSITGKLNEQKKAQIKWSVNEYSVSDYSVERSSDARSYTAIGALNSKGDGQQEYYFTDANTELKTAFYRIKQTDWNGKFTYSPMIKITRQENANNEPSVFPNPFINGFTVLTNKQENAKLYNAAGKLIRQLTLSSGSTYVSTGIICSGLYYLQFENGKTIMLTKQ